MAYSIVIPAYNEAKRLPSTLDSILAFLQKTHWNAEVIVVNDGSTDDTARVVRNYRERFAGVRLVDNKLNQGKGRSIRDGVMQATGDIILFTDADNSTPIEDADKLVEAISEGADVAIGSRWLQRNLQTLPQPWYRRLNGRIYNLLLRIFLGLDFKDTQNGFKAYSRQAAKTIFPLQRIPGWGFDAEVLFLARKFAFVTREVPVEYIYCAEGSKISPYRDGLRMFAELIKLRWYSLTGAYSTNALPSRNAASQLSDVAIQSGRLSK